MNILQRQIIIGASLAFFVFLFALATFFAAFPLSDWSLLWEREIIDVPFIIFISGISVFIGIVFGVISGFFWRKQLHVVEEMLRKIEQGQQAERNEPLRLKELELISARIGKIQKYLAEQTKLSQRLASEKAEEQERRIQEIVSEERHRLARELHDSVSQQLFAASMLISAINEAQTCSDDVQAKQLKLVEEMIHQSQLEMRALLLHLRPVALKGKSLQEGIEELLRELQQKIPLNIQWKIEHFSLDKGIEDHLFRILQESVSNTLRHAKATSLEVLLVKRDSLIILRVVDDGVGFDVEKTKTGSYGLQNMHERAVEIGGTLHIVSVPNQGTRLEVRIPLLSSEGEEKND
jgi:two-component system, NarL family, sensor histidine kinase LiaS